MTEDAESSCGHCRNSGNDRRRIMLASGPLIVRGPQVSSVIAPDPEQVTFELFGSIDATRRHRITSWRLPIAAAFAFFPAGFPSSSARKSRSPPGAAAGAAQAIYLANDPRRSAGESGQALVRAGTRFRTWYSYNHVETLDPSVSSPRKITHGLVPHEPSPLTHLFS